MIGMQYIVLMFGSVTAAMGDEVSFNRDVLPILSNNCFPCHGPDGGARQAKLRLDQRERALAVITSGSAAESELMVRVRAERPDDRMPPIDSGRSLSEKQIETLRRWIDSGAEWEGHWAFDAPTKQPLPMVSREEWCQTPIDRFVLARLDDEGLGPNAEADRRTLIRRVTLDLIGLPPTRKEVAAFLEDSSPNAYERVVDRLLASPHYGEHAARPWLDLARYADSQGFEKDNLRTMWRFRDWVIEALNADMAFDQFTREQIAGDLLPEATMAQQIATGFHRNTQTNTEGGTDDEEFRSAAVIDRVNTTMQGWMGLTAGCAQCHDHKFDPISQQEYYQLYAFFNQTKDNDSNNDQPFIKAPRDEEEARFALLEAELTRIEQKFRAPDDQMLASIESWLASRPTEEDWQTLQPVEAIAESKATLEVEADGILVAKGESPAKDTYTIRFENLPSTLTGLRLEVFEGEDGYGPGRTEHGNFVVNEVELRIGATDPAVKFSKANATFNQVEFGIEKAIDGKLGANSGWAIAPNYAQDQQAVFILAVPAEVPDGFATLVLRQTHGTQHTLARFRIAATSHVAPALSLSGELESIVAMEPTARSPQQWTTLVAAAIDKAPGLKALHDARVAAHEKRDKLEKKIPLALVMEELPEPSRRMTYLFNGGTFLSPDVTRGPLSPSVPEVLHPIASDTPSRLDLADWLVAAENPLTARVQVNRHWARLFGLGLVSTLDDFGVQGARPSHPALLDFLARYWQDELAWSQKSLVRLIVTSATYRQSSKVDPTVLARDPSNRLLSRAPRLRLSAEALRDSSLETSGLLVRDRIGGPSVVPRMPKGMLPQAFTDFVPAESTGDDLYLRGLYTQWRRTGHYPTFATFDAPSREFCLVARERSNTPLQALVMLNDSVFIEAAQGLARRVLVSDQPDVEGQIELAFELALARTPANDETEVLRGVYDAALREAMRHTDDAKALATEPIGPLPEGLPVEVAAAMTVVANVVLNLDEFVNRP